MPVYVFGFWLLLCIQVAQAAASGQELRPTSSQDGEDASCPLLLAMYAAVLALKEIVAVQLQHAQEEEEWGRCKGAC
jgi:hypothetical protein